MAETITVESHGATVEVDPGRLADQRFTYCLSRTADGRLADDRKLVFYGRMLSVLLGDDGAYEAMCDLADANGGAVGAELFNDFFADVLEQVGAKNS